MYSTPSRSFPRAAATAALIVLALATGTASANDVTTYGQESLFDQAAPGLASYVFPVGSGDGSFEARPYILGPLGFSTYQHFTHPYLENDGAYGTGVTYLAMRGIPSVNVAMQTQVDGIYALGFNLGTYEGADAITVTINFGESVGTFTTDAGAGSSTFFGIVSSDPIQQISFTTQTGEEIDILNFKANAISAVPEPASMALALAGLGVVGVVARRRKIALA